MALTEAASKLPSRTKRLRTTSKAIGGAGKPTAEPTPALGRDQHVGDFRASRPGARHARARPPPKAIRVRPSSSAPRSTAWTRAALAMFLLDHLGDAEGCERGVELERAADMGVDGGAAERGIEHDRTAGKTVGIDAASNDIGIGDRGPDTTLPIAGRSGIGARAFSGPTVMRFNLVRHRPATPRQRRSRHISITGMRNRQAAAFHEAVAAIDLEAARVPWACRRR